MAVTITKITNANVYLENKSLLGVAAEIDLPSVNQKITTISALGLAATIELPAGIEALEARLKFNRLDKQVLLAAGNPYQFRVITCFMDAET